MVHKGFANEANLNGVEKMKITFFDKNAARAFSKAVDAALISLAAEYGLKVQGAGGKFSASKLTVKFEFIVSDVNGFNDHQQQNWDAHCSVFGLKPSDRGLKVMGRNGTQYILTGFNMNAVKFPLRALRASDNKAFRISPTMIVGWGEFGAPRS